MKLHGSDGGELMDVAEIERDGCALMIRGKVFGAMPIAARLTPAEARAGLKLLNIRLVLFLLTFLFRRG